MIGGIDARGFVLGPPIALALKKPFCMLRKKGKMPNAITGETYRLVCVSVCVCVCFPFSLSRSFNLAF